MESLAKRENVFWKKFQCLGRKGQMKNSCGKKVQHVRNSAARSLQPGGNAACLTVHSFSSPKSYWVAVEEKPGEKSVFQGDLSISWMLTLCITLLR